MSTMDIGKLFDFSRLPCGLSVVPIILYFPLGVILGILRLFIAIHAYVIACVLPRSFIIRGGILRVLCAVIGVIVRVDDKRTDRMTAPLLVSNHVSMFDHMAISLVIHSITPSVWDIPAGLAWLLGYRDMGVKKGTDVLMGNIKHHFNKSSLPVLVFPEGGTTNGAVGLLKFSEWPFTLQKSIQPIALSVSRILPIAVAPVGSRWWSDALWFLFSPYTIFTLRLLPVIESQEGEDCVELTKRTERCIADSLGVSNTPHSDKDKVEYVKRLLFVQPDISARSNVTKKCTVSQHTHNSGIDPEVLRMSAQVHTVLPDIPLHAIQLDIAKTLNVDETITNFLEGKVVYSSDVPTASTSGQNSDSMVFAATQFSKNASSRQLSYKERKQQMIELARQKYKQKHGLL